MAHTQALFEAIEFAAKAHRGQYRKGTKIPYIVHPLAVSRILVEIGAPQSVAVAGVLHDTIEDTGVRLSDVRKKFGPVVARLVAAVSEPDKSDTWENRKKHTIEYLEHKAPTSVLLLSCADKLDNIRAIRADYDAIGEKLWKRFNRPKDQQQWYYRSLSEAFLRRRTTAMTTILFEMFEKEVNHVFNRT